MDPNTSNNNNGNNFARTCNRLSQFMKERRRSLGDQGGFAIPHMVMPPSPSPSSKPDPGGFAVPHVAVAPSPSSMLDPNRVEEKLGKNKDTMSLFPENMEKKKEIISVPDSPVDNKSLNLNLFPLGDPSIKGEEFPKTSTKEREVARPIEEPKNARASMTMFYGGKVLIFDDFPEDKAEEIISLATQVTSKRTHPQTTIEAETQTQPHALTSPRSNLVPLLDKQDTVSQETVGPSDLPIARRTSLFRFIEKRKDRVASAAPYQPPNPSTSSTNSHRQRYNVVMRNLLQRRQEEQKRKQLLD